MVLTFSKALLTKSIAFVAISSVFMDSFLIPSLCVDNLYLGIFRKSSTLELHWIRIDLDSSSIRNILVGII